MVSELNALGVRFEAVGIACVWLALLLRAPSAIRSRQQRGLWIAVLAAVSTMTLKRGFVVALVVHDSRLLHIYALSTHLVGVLSAVIVLDFIMVTTGRYSREWLNVLAGLVLVAMVVLGLKSEPGLTVEDGGGSAAGLLFWLIVIAAHLAADGVCVGVCHWYRKAGLSPSLRRSLDMFGLGSAFAALYWVVLVIRLATSADWLTPVLPISMGLYCFSRVAVIAVPAVPALRRARREALTFWRLWKLWRELVAAVPSVALAPPRPRLLELLLPRGPWRLLVYREVIEIRDAMLVLRDYAPDCPPLLEEERELSARQATALAGWLRAACLAKRRGQGPRPQSEFAVLGGRDLIDETAFLVQVARAHEAASARAGSLLI